MYSLSIYVHCIQLVSEAIVRHVWWHEAILISCYRVKISIPLYRLHGRDMFNTLAGSGTKSRSRVWLKGTDIGAKKYCLVQSILATILSEM